jgi:hypothetical protein
LYENLDCLNIGIGSGVVQRGAAKGLSGIYRAAYAVQG